MLDHIWQQDYRWLEGTHDYIQWLFPLLETSRFNPHAPILTESDIHTFRNSPDLKRNLQRSVQLMLDFYGLQLQEPPLTIIPSNTFPERQKQWLHWGNHNHLRITRILKSLRLLGLETYSQALFICLEQIYTVETGKITKLTFSYWQEAAYQ